MPTTLPAMQQVIATRPAPAMVSASSPVLPAKPVKRISSAGLMEGGREVEIEHAGRVYRLRVTQLNKLILTA